MPIRDAPIQIANLSRGQLKNIAEREGVDVTPTATKIDLIRDLSNLPRDRLEEIAGDYMYAGRTSATWIQLWPNPTRVDLDQLKATLTEICGADPFAAELRPALSSSPELLSARVWRDDKIVLTFGIQGHTRIVFNNYRLEEVTEDKSFEAIIRLRVGVLELRTSRDQAELVADGFGQKLAAGLGAQPVELYVGEDRLEALRRELNAKMSEYTALDESPSPYRTHAVSKKPSCEDLATDQRFQSDFDGMPPVNAHLEFVGPDGENVKISVSVRSRSVYFRTVSSEQVLDLVFAAVRRVARR